MSVFESLPRRSWTMDQDQTFPMVSTDIREDPDIFERESECDQLKRWADSFVHEMETPIDTSRRVGLNTTPSVHTYSHSTPVADLHPSSTSFNTNEYNQFNLQNITAPTPLKWKNNETILEDS